MLGDAEKAVAEFHRVAEFELPSTPTLLSRERVELRAKWIREEIEELLAAQDLAQQADAAADIVYFAIGIFVELGISASDIFSLVHKSNMEKLKHREKFRRDIDGKVLKPSDWQSPDAQIREYIANSAKAPSVPPCSDP